MTSSGELVSLPSSTKELKWFNLMLKGQLYGFFASSEQQLAQHLSWACKDAFGEEDGYYAFEHLFEQMKGAFK